MENKLSPFGNVCGVRLAGTMQDNGRVIQLSVSLLCDAGLNVVHVPVDSASRDKLIEWGGSGDMGYESRHSNGGDATGTAGNVKVSVSYFHDVDSRSLLASLVVTFDPHGWVRLADVTILLERSETTDLRIPRDIAEERLLTLTMSNDNIESIYGRRLPPGKRDEILRFHNKFEKRHRPNRQEEEEEGKGTEAKKKQCVEFNTFSKQRAIALQEEAALVASLSSEWEWPLKQFIRGILGDSGRVTQIIRQWHTRLIPVQGETSSDVFANFIETLLFAEKTLQLTETHLYLFNPCVAPSLGIAISSLTTQEQIFCNRLYVNRARLFARINEQKKDLGVSQYKLSNFRLDVPVVSVSFCPRFIVHQFAIDCLDCTFRAQRPIVLLTLISAVGRVYVKHPKDPFMTRLKIALEKPSIQTAVDEVAMFVRVGLNVDKPSYEPVILLQKDGYPRDGRATPYRLTA